MAKKKKSSPPKRVLKRQSAPKIDIGALPDRRALEGIMQNLFGGMAGGGDQTPLDRAQAIMYDAFDATSPKERIKLARKALEISPDCADAYVLLAENAESLKEAMDLYEQGVAAGERAIGERSFREDAGVFWGILETRPYMRARAGLADLLWTSGRRDDAIGHLREMLRLNPNDNQGLRYPLASWLLAEGHDEELARLLEQYDDASASWAYSKTLAAFRQHGDTPATRKSLQSATKVNKYIPDYLTGEKMMPRERPGMYTLGSEEEAILYAAESLPAWKTTPGATAWLRESGPKKKRKAPKPKTQGPLPLVKKRLEKIPKEFDIWQADCRQFGPRIQEGGELHLPWLTVVMSRTNDLIHAQAMSLEPPTADALWDRIASAIQNPAVGEPHRPSELQIIPGERWDEIRPDLEEIGIVPAPVEELDLIDFMLGELQKSLSADAPPGLVDIEGVGPAELTGFYAAAAEYYRKAPWRKVGGEAAIRVESDSLEKGPRFAVVMGQSGMTFGLALYDDLKILRKLWDGNLSDKAGARETVALSVTFDTELDTADADLNAIEEYGLDVAGPEAYPTIFRKEKGMKIRAPLAWELELMEGCLQAIPDFIAEHPPGDPAKHKMTVPVASGKMHFVLSWVDD
jgi:tetratricopeptide (TPR) repeat protein